MREIDCCFIDVNAWDDCIEDRWIYECIELNMNDVYDSWNVFTPITDGNYCKVSRDDCKSIRMNDDKNESLDRI